MSDKTGFDIDPAHRHFAVECFNRAWELMEKPDRAAEEDEQMIRLSLASHWHWTQRPDCTEENISIGYWQTSRIYALLGQAANARRYAQLCLEASRAEGLPPYCLGYAYEALARAESVAGARDQAQAYVSQARQVADRMSDPEARQMLLDDLGTIG